jgi:hypothetical protein
MKTINYHQLNQNQKWKKTTHTTRLSSIQTKFENVLVVIIITTSLKTILFFLFRPKDSFGHRFFYIQYTIGLTLLSTTLSIGDLSSKAESYNRCEQLIGLGPK